MLGRDDIGVDFGTSTCLVTIKGRGIALREPALCAVDKNTRNILAVGDDAISMLGRVPPNIVLVRPLKHGSVSDYDITMRMFRYYLRKSQGRRNVFRPRAFLCLPGSLTDVELRSLSDAILDAGARRTQVIDSAIASALGAGLDVTNSYGHMIVDIGGGITDIAVIARGRVVARDSTRPGGDRFSEAIARVVRRKHSIVIGERTADEIKLTMGDLTKKTDTPMQMSVTGRNLALGLPRTVLVKSNELASEMEEVAQEIAEGIHIVLENTLPELAADIFEHGITLTGGGALLPGLSDLLGAQLKVPFRVPSDPQTAAAVGLSYVMDNLEGLESIFR
ncbi:MAG: rod shape-determining protein [Oscillospiraceae bacterium]|jgi:rod shape-determining protein MreB|nr:rod shape-determining protein [Oscillospiraceae bacterium]